MSDIKKDGLAACVIGASGYVGGELLRCLGAHGAFERIVPVSRSLAGKKVASSHPALAKKLDAVFTDSPAEPGDVDVVFFATPPGVAMEHVALHLDAGAMVVDCSPDFRIKDVSVWEEHYGTKHAAPELIEKAVYGQVEHNRNELQKARLVAAPGCYATLLQLAITPVAKALADAGCKNVTVIADCVSGTSGAGRRTDRSDLLLAEAGGNFSAYALGGHRHVPEVLQEIEKHSGLDLNLEFVPHLLPVPRGMFATVHFVADRQIDLHLALNESYGKERFIDVLEPGVSPQLAAVCNTNLCQLGCAANSQVVLGALDNLGKGAASQAVQAFNVAWGLDEWMGMDG